MSKHAKNIDKGLQPGLFESYPGSGDDDAMIRATLTDAIKRCPKKREQIAEEMTACVGREITAAMLNSFTAESHESHRWPAAWTRAFCQITGDWRLLRCAVERAGFLVITQSQARLLKLAEEYMQKETAVRRLSVLTEQMLQERA